MTTSTSTKSAVTLVASASNAAGATVRGATKIYEGAFVTLKISNGATGPTAPCVCTISVSHDTGVTPSTGAVGAVWKTMTQFAGATANSGVVERSLWVDGGQHVQVEFSGNTAQAVTVEALATVTTGYASA